MRENINKIIPGFISDLWRQLNKRRKFQFLLLIFLILITSIAEIASLGAVLPFLSAISNPQNIYNQPYLEPIIDILGIKSEKQIILPITILFISASLFAATMRILLLWFSTKLSFGSGADLSAEAFKKTLYQPYDVHVSRNSSEVVSGIMTKMNSATATINFSLNFIGSFIISLAIISALLFINPFIAVVSCLFFGSCYISISLLSRPRLTSNSVIISRYTSESQKILQEGLGGIRDTLLDGNQYIFFDKFAIVQRKMRSSQGQNLFIGGSPRYIMESLGITLIALLAFSFASDSEKSGDFIAVLGAMALGAQRLIPSLQQVYSAWSGITGHKESLLSVIDLLNQSTEESQHNLTYDALILKREINFDSVYFRYNKNEPWILKDINLKIYKGMSVGIVGHTGCGKSTLIDILMGLLKPTKGILGVDSNPIENLKTFEWQKSISHVPQSIFLADMTIAENIAFGVDKNKINKERIKQVCKQAQLDEFVENLPNKYNSIVGEQGIWLSGGQRQRIGIARALYKDSNILILDEATSALDSLTESHIMDSIRGLSEKLTVFIIAHRISTIKDCDIIIVMENGTVSTMGSYESLIKESEIFRNLAAHT